MTTRNELEQMRAELIMAKQFLHEPGTDPEAWINGVLMRLDALLAVSSEPEPERFHYPGGAWVAPAVVPAGETPGSGIKQHPEDLIDDIGTAAGETPLVVPPFQHPGYIIRKAKPTFPRDERTPNGDVSQATVDLGSAGAATTGVGSVVDLRAQGVTIKALEALLKEARKRLLCQHNIKANRDTWHCDACGLNGDVGQLAVPLAIAAYDELVRQSTLRALLAERTTTEAEAFKAGWRAQLNTAGENPPFPHTRFQVALAAYREQKGRENEEEPETLYRPPRGSA